MGRMIDADELITAFPCGETVRTECVRATIEHMSTIEERKTGKWIYYDSDSDRYDDVKCSVCGKRFTVDAERWCDIGFTISDLNFCPNCGSYNVGEKSMRLIDADAFIAKLNHVPMVQEAIRKAMDTMPTIEERKTGKWVKTGQSFVFPNKFKGYSCSCCGFYFNKENPLFLFCPHCGARMMQEGEEHGQNT